MRGEYIHEEHPSCTKDNRFHNESTEFVAFSVDEVVENPFDIELVFGTVLSLTEVHYIVQFGVFLWRTEHVLEACWWFDYPRSLSQLDCRIVEPGCNL